MCSDLLSAYTSVRLVSLVPVEDRRGSQIPWSQLTWEPACGCGELNAGPLEEQPVFLTAGPPTHLFKFAFIARTKKSID